MCYIILIDCLRYFNLILFLFFLVAVVGVFPRDLPQNVDQQQRLCRQGHWTLNIIRYTKQAQDQRWSRMVTSFIAAEPLRVQNTPLGDFCIFTLDRMIHWCPIGAAQFGDRIIACSIRYSPLVCLRIRFCSSHYGENDTFVLPQHHRIVLKSG